MPNALKSSVHKILGRHAALAPDPSQEATYRHLFVRELERLGEADVYFPTGGAANYSLLYLLIRIAKEHRPRKVLDVGCGQSTLLWDRLRDRGLAGSILTLESDAAWGATIGGRVEHEVLVTPLRPMTIHGVTTQTYDWAQALARGPFDVMVIDGPIGQPHNSRFGVLNLLDDLPADFVIVVDDAERAGEQDTVTAVHDRLKALGKDYVAGAVRAAKTQVVFCGGSYTSCAFY